jgi:hypothetical protein
VIVRKGRSRHNEKFELCPLFTATLAPFADFQAKDTAVWASGFRYVAQIPHPELLEGMNRRPILRIGQTEQSAAMKLLESERKLGLTDLGGNSPAPGLSREHKANFEIVRAKRSAGK